MFENLEVGQENKTSLNQKTIKLVFETRDKHDLYMSLRIRIHSIRQLTPQGSLQLSVRKKYQKHFPLESVGEGTVKWHYHWNS